MQCPLVDSIWASFPSLPDNINGELLSCSDPPKQAVLCCFGCTYYYYSSSGSQTNATLGSFFLVLQSNPAKPGARARCTRNRQFPTVTQWDTSTDSRAEEVTLGCTGLTNAETYWSSAVCLIRKVVMGCILTQLPERWQKTGKDAGAQPRGMDGLCQQHT